MSFHRTLAAWISALVLVGLAGSSAIADEALPVFTLEQCVGEALRNGPDILLANANLAMAEAERDQAVAKNGFGIGSGASAQHAVNHTDTSGATSSAARGKAASVITNPNANPTDNLQASLTLTGPLATSIGLSAGQIITESDPPDQASRFGLSLSSTLWDGYTGGRALAALRQAELGMSVKRSADESGRLSLVFSVKQAYYSYLGQQRQIEILTRTLDSRKEEEARTQSLYDSGRASRIDLRQAGVNRRQAELDLAKARNALEIDRERLSALVGWSADLRYGVAETVMAANPSMDAASAVKAALENRPEMRQLLLNAASGAIALDLAKSLSAPVVGVSGSLAFTNDWTNGVNRTDWSAGLNVNWPLLDSGTIAAQARQAAQQNRVYSIQRSQLAERISTDVREAMNNLRDLLQRIDLAADSLDLAKDQFDLAETQFAEGTGTNLDLLTASVALSTAEVGLAKAKSDAQLGLLALQNAMGE